MNCGFEYLDAMNINLLQGRNFDRNHRADDRGAYIINETAAKEFGWKAPLGKRIWGPLGTDRSEGEVIGVVKDFHFASLHSKIEPLIIFLVNKDWGIRYVYVKVNPIRPANLISGIGQEYQTVFKDLPFEWEYLDSKFTSLYREDREIKSVFQVGLVISILVSCLGIFGISALLMIMRTREMGIRKVIGATQLQLFVLHMKGFIKFIVISMLIACPAIYFLSNRWLDNFAYHIDLGIWYFIIPCLLTIMIILAITGFHGFKSSRVNPVDVIRHE
jgi:putative ABC transport system permease protein